MAKSRELGKKAVGFWSEFRNFAVKGDALDLAIAVVIGNAFSAIVNSLVADILTPLLGLVSGNGTTDIKTLTANLAGPDHPLLLHYGTFIQTVINFFIIALSIFLLFKLVSGARRRLFRQGEDAVPEYTKPPQELLLEEIRDLLKEKK